MARKLKIGDVVQLRSERGPEMTVERINAEDVGVVWFDANEQNLWTGPHRAEFPAKALVHVDEDV